MQFDWFQSIFTDKENKEIHYQSNESKKKLNKLSQT